MLFGEELETKCILETDIANASDGLPVCNSSVMEVVTEFTPPLWSADFPVAVLYCAILAVGLLIGTCGNIIIVIVSFTTNTMNKVGKDFVINLALADLCVNVIAEPMCILGVVKGEKWFNHRWFLCEVVAGMCITACFCAFLSLTMLTLNKYLFVCRNRIYQKFCKRSICITVCVACWILAFLFEFPNIIGWGGHYFDKKNHQCVWQRTASLSYTLLVSIGFIGAPLVIMGFCFILIFFKIWRTKKDVFNMNHDDPLRMRRVWLESFRTSRTLVVVFIAFVICWTPYAVIIHLDFADKFPVEVHLFVTLLAHTHSSLNFIIYMTFSTSFRQTVRKMFSCLTLNEWKFRNSIETASSRSTTEIARSELDTERPKKYYMNPSFRQSQNENLKCIEPSITSVLDPHAKAVSMNPDTLKVSISDLNLDEQPRY